jgi:23S rRNA (guanosine2251-2'-O)-methyltransferase
MAGNSQRRGATRKGNSRKGPSVGSGGQKRQGLEPKGPTPKAVERQHHPAARRARAAQKRAEAAAPRRSSSRRNAGSVLAGRNPVVEALRAGIPASTLYTQTKVESDDRWREARCEPRARNTHPTGLRGPLLSGYTMPRAIGLKE